MTKQMFLFPQEIISDTPESSLFPETETHSEVPTDEKWQRSIPAQVFLNHFFAIHYHIEHSHEAYQLYNLPHFLDFHPTMTESEVAATRNLLVQSWSTEYALRTTADLGDEEYLRNALHWTFPQAFYSMYLSIRAFLMTHGVTGNNEELVRREVGRLVVKGFYPLPVSFYAAGHYGDTSIIKLPLAGYKAGLHLPTKALDAQAHIAQFLRTSRNLQAKAIKQRLQGNPQTALRSQHTGEILENFSRKHWKQVTWRIGYTTYFDLMKRLRISAGYREIERFTQADIDFHLFHKSLLAIVSYLNFVHESYIAKAMGLEKYAEMVQQLPAYLKNGFVKQRFDDKIVPILHQAELLKDNWLQAA
ncbi:MAG: hypothetical protein H7Y04_10165 [Verrucomicrobia bacterium]|nr:hypothetical protein [Cytophagales bacterium]